MANTMTQSETRNNNTAPQAKSVNKGRFEKGSERAREAGRKGGQKSSRSA